MSDAQAISRAAQSTPQKDYSGSYLQKSLLAQNDAKAEPSMSLNLDSPELEAPPVDNSGSGLNNLSIGGALDMRFLFPRIGGTTESESGFGNLNIHVAELFITTNIGDHISVLMEQLLVTAPMENTIGQDHGFVYGIFSNIPGLPDNISLKVGRTRFRFGIDSKLDSPANTLHSPVYKTLGMITDKGIELSGYSGPMEWSLGVTNGADVLQKNVMTTDDQMAMIEVEARNGSKPVLARVSVDVTDSLHLGVSGYTGKTYPIYSSRGVGHDMIFNGHWDQSLFVYKNRAAVDALVKLGSKLQLAGEYTFGKDRDKGQSYDVTSYFVRSDYQILPQKLAVQLQYELYKDGRNDSMLDMRDTGNIGVGLLYYLTPQSWLRASWLQDDVGLFRESKGQKSEYIATLQTLLAF